MQCAQSPETGLRQNRPRQTARRVINWSHHWIVGNHSRTSASEFGGLTGFCNGRQLVQRGSFAQMTQSNAASRPDLIEQFTPKLLTVLREGYRLRDLGADAMAGLTVAIVALSMRWKGWRRGCANRWRIAATPWLRQWKRRAVWRRPDSPLACNLHSRELPVSRCLGPKDHVLTRHGHSGRAGRIAKQLNTHGKNIGLSTYLQFH